LSNAVFAAYYGGEFFNSASPFVKEYIRLKRLKGLGITMQMDKMNPFTLECFAIIDCEFERLSGPKTPAPGDDWE